MSVRSLTGSGDKGSRMETANRPDTTEEARALYDEAYRLAKNKQPKEAIPLFTQIIRWEKGPVANKVRREAHLNALWCLVHVQDWAGLDDLSRLAIHRYPEAAWPYRYMGEAFFRQDKMKKAIASLEKAIEIDPESSEARVVLELVLRRGRRAMRRRLSSTRPRLAMFSETVVVRITVLASSRSRPLSVWGG